MYIFLIVIAGILIPLVAIFYSSYKTGWDEGLYDAMIGLPPLENYDGIEDVVIEPGTWGGWS